MSTRNTAPQKVEIEVPEGMDAAKLKNLIANYETKRVKNSAKNKARRNAMTKLIKAHQAEFDGYLKEAMPKA